MLWNKKKLLQAIKIRNLKSRKNEMFAKLLVQNWPFFHLFILGNIAQENVFYDILERKNACLGYKNKQFKKSKNYDFCERFSLWFWSKSGHFSNVLFQAIQARKFCFTLFQNEKNPFQAIKTKSSKSRQIKMFANRLVHFSPKPCTLPFEKISFFCVFF